MEQLEERIEREDREYGGFRRHPGTTVTRADLEQAAAAVLERFPQVDAVFLFGSHARGNPHARSDADFALVPLAPLPLGQQSNLQLEAAALLEDLLWYPVDAVVVDPSLEPGLLFDIFRIETPLATRDLDRARRVAAMARAEYRDLLPRLERHHQRVLERIAEHANALLGP